MAGDTSSTPNIAQLTIATLPGGTMRSIASNVILLAVLAAPAAAQLPNIRLDTVSPPGVQAGQSIEVTVSGGDMDEGDRLVFDHPGITAEQKTKEVAGETVPVDNQFVVTVAGNVPPGNYEVRLGGYFGVSNPRTFVVGSRPETSESEANNDFENADELALNSVVNGQVGGTADLDYFAFEAKAGQHVVATVRARRIDSRLDPVLELYDANRRLVASSHADVHGDAAVDAKIPSDGTYYVKLYDFAYQGSSAHFYRLVLHDGPFVDFVFPPAGKPGSNDEYTVYGRNLPNGQPSGVKVDGRELEMVKARIALPNEADRIDVDVPLGPHESGVDGITWRLNGPNGPSNAVLVQLADAPVAVEQEPNDEPKTVQTIPVPVDLAAQFQKKGDIDFYEFDAKAGDVYFVEVIAHRQGGLADPYFVLEQITRSEGGEEQVKRITAQDDYTPQVDNNRNKPTNGQFSLVTADPVYRFEAPADAKYRVQVRDRYFENRGDPSLVYRLCIRPESPDYRLVTLPLGVGQRNQPATPSSVTLRKGENIDVPVMIVRRDGFDGIVDLKVEGLPAGVVAKPAVIGPGEVGTTLVFSASQDAAVGFGRARVLGSARILDPAKVRAVERAEKQLVDERKKLDQVEKGKDDAAKETQRKVVADLEQRIAQLEKERDGSGREINRVGRSATIVWPGQNNVSATSIRLSRSLGVSVLDETVPYQVVSDVERLEVNQGRQVLVPVKLLKRDGFDEQVKLAFVGLPKNSNVQVQNANIDKGQDEQLLRMFVNSNALVGGYTVYLSAQSSVNYSRNPKFVERLKERQKKFDEMLKAAQESKKKADAEKSNADKAAQEAENKLKAAQQKVQQAEQQAKQKPEDAAAKQAVADAKKELTAAESAKKSADEAKANAETEARAAADAEKQVSDAKKQVDGDLKNAENAAKPKKTNVTPPSTSLVLVVKPRPAELSANVQNGGNLKRGQKLEIKAKVKRVNGFEGPVTLVLPDLPGVKGLSASPVTIPADQDEGTLIVQASGDATEGQIPNAVVRAMMDFDGKAAVDAPVTIKVSK